MDETVTPVPVASIEVDPPEITVIVGQTTTLSAILLDAEGNRLDRVVDWSSESSGVASVDGSGQVEGVTPGQTRVFARAGGASDAAQVTVTPGPTLSLDRATVSFEATAGRDDPDPVTVQIRNSGPGTLSGISVAVEYADGEPSGWLGVSLAGTTAPTSLVLRPTTGSLPPGSYEARVDVFAANAANSPQSIVVDFDVAEPPPRLVLSTNQVSFSATFGASQPATQTIAVQNGGGGTLDGLSVEVSYSGRKDWLTATLEASTAPTTLTLSASAQGLNLGTHEATVEVRSPAAENGPQQVAVSFTVTLTGVLGAVEGAEPVEATATLPAIRAAARPGRSAGTRP